MWAFLILDVNSGYTDLAMAQSVTISSSAIAMQRNYPDRICDAAAMFSYALMKISRGRPSCSRIDTSLPFG